MKIGIGILAGGKDRRNSQRRNQGKNQAKVKLSNMVGAKRLMEELSSLGPASIANDTGDKGPMGGVYSLLKEIDTEYIFVCGADMPNITKELAGYMSQFISSDYDCYCIREHETLQPLCAIYSKAMLPLIEEAISQKDYSLTRLIQRARTKYISLEYTSFKQDIIKDTYRRTAPEPMKAPVVFCVCGDKNTGKTGLVIKLINEFIKQGQRVATIKHDGHCYTMDHEGTDSYRFFQAGACKSLIFSEQGFALNSKEASSPEELIAMCQGVDVVIIEGLKASPYPKILMKETLGQEADDLAQQKSLICIATKDKSPETNSAYPIMDRDDAKGIFSLIKDYFKLDIC